MQDIINSQDINGDTPLHIAARSGDYDMIAIVIQSGANPTIRNYNGYTPGDLAIVNGHIQDGIWLNTIAAKYSKSNIIISVL